MVYKEVDHSRDLWSALIVSDNKLLIILLSDTEPARKREGSVVWEYFEFIFLNRVGLPAFYSCCLSLF